MGSHLPFLMRTDADLASRHGAAKQNIVFCPVFCEVCVRMVVFDCPFEESSCTCETPPLMTDCRQDNSIDGGRVPDVLILTAVKAPDSVGGF